MREITLKLTSAIALDGEICRAGSLVVVTDDEAKNLLARGKAELATEDDAFVQPEPEPEPVKAPAKPPKPSKD